MDQFEVVVSKAEALTPRIREFVLARANGAPMSVWAPAPISMSICPMSAVAPIR